MRLVTIEVEVVVQRDGARMWGIAAIKHKP